MGRTTRARRTPAEIADAIRLEILRGELRPGASARQDELAARFDVSRVPVREALRSLAAEGLVTWESQRGFRIAQLAPEEVRELLEIRSLLETQALMHALPQITADDISAASEALNRSEATQSLQEWSEMNTLFHATLLGRCGKPHLLQLIEQLNNRVTPYIRLLIAASNYRQRAEREHRAILSAVEVGSFEAGRILLSRHIEDTALALERLLASHRRDA